MPGRLSLLLLLLLGCVAPVGSMADDAAARAQLAARWDAYTRAVPKVDPETTSAFFSPNAFLFEPGIRIATRDSIRAFVAGFAGVKVDSFASTVDTIEIHGDHAALWGTFRESYTMPGQPMVNDGGRFVTEWSRQADGSWLIDRFMTQPAPPPPTP